MIDPLLSILVHLSNGLFFVTTLKRSLPSCECFSSLLDKVSRELIWKLRLIKREYVSYTIRCYKVCKKAIFFLNHDKWWVTNPLLRRIDSREFSSFVSVTHLARSSIWNVRCSNTNKMDGGCVKPRRGQRGES